MKLTKEQWKQLSDRIFLTLRPTQHPVAMKFIKTPEEFDAIPDIEFCQNKASTCKLIGMAAHFQGTFGLTPASRYSGDCARLTVCARTGPAASASSAGSGNRQMRGFVFIASSIHRLM